MLVRTWNLFHGNAQPPERRTFLPAMVELVAADDPDVVCLQEVPPWALGKLAGWSGMQAVTAVTRRPRAGSARLGRWLTAANHGLLRSAVTGEGSAVLVAHRWQVAAADVHVVGRTPLRRTAQCVRIGDDLDLVNCHLNADPDELRRAVELAEAPRAIVAGDWNLRPPYDLAGWSEPLEGSIDQILVRCIEVVEAAAAWPVERRRIDGRVVSDHAPVELRLG